MSGYPLANALRLLLSSKKHFVDFLRKALGEVEQSQTYICQGMISHYDRFAPSIELFRHGGFATVDEFCKLATGSKEFALAVEHMRALTVIVLGLHHPEKDFHESQYYGFVQRLFDRSLCGLRDDVAVLSFNYDPYLEFVLSRALQERSRIAGCKLNDNLLNAATGGFWNVNTWAQNATDGRGFVLLKLHGSITNAQATDVTLGYKDVIQDDPSTRISRLTSVGLGKFKPPLLFPWELFDAKGGFIDAKSIPADVPSFYYEAFQATWRRAQAEVSTAQKISFVGLSMHEYLEQGLRFLFRLRHGHIDVVMADPANAPFATTTEDPGPAKRPGTPAHRLRTTLKRVAPGLQNAPANGLRHRYDDGSLHIRCLPNFSDFIRLEMD